MAGKIQLAAKILLGTTLLGSGGGVYYATTNGLFLPAQSGGAKQEADSNLEAVVSAWAEPSAPLVTDARQSSLIARSAVTASNRAEKASVKSTADDRYGAPVKAPSSTEVAKDDAKDSAKKKDAEQKAPSESQPVNADEPAAVTLASHIEIKPGEEKPRPTLATSAPEPELARGQEPKDDAPAAVPVNNSSADIGGALDAVAKNGNQPREPRTLNASGQQANITDASQRAKEAFGNPAAPASGDRYGGAAPSGSESAAQPKPLDVNPFGSKPVAATSAPAGAKSGLIEPLPSNSNDIGTPLRDLQQGNNAPRPIDANTMPRAATGNYSSQDRGPRAAPLRAVPNAEIGPLPTSSGTSLPGVGDSSKLPIAGDGTGKPGEKALEGPQQPTLVIQKFAPGEIQVGKPAKFTLQVRNAGSQAAENVTVQDEIPQGTQLVSTSPNATNDGARLTWQLGKLSPGEDRTVEIQVMPKSEGEIGSVATVTYSAQASVKTRCTMPQLAIRMTAPSEVMIGKQQHVKIEIRNPGSGDATGVMLFENVPPNVKHAAGPALEFEIGTLRPGETRELDLVLTAEKAGKVVNTLTARAHGNLQVQQQVEFEIIAPALAVAVQGPERRYLERPATYEVSVENPGTAAAHDVQIVTKLPKGMRFVKANNMGEYDAASHAVYWSLAELPKGERGTVELVAVPVETGPQTLQVESRAQQGLTDRTQREVLVEGLAAIKFEVRALEDPIEIGKETGYEIRVVNQGTKAATNLQIGAELPPGLKFVSAEGETTHKVQQGQVLFEPLQTLAPKADTVYRIRAQGVQAGDQRIAVLVKTDDLAQPLRREESTRVFGDQ